MRREPWNDCVEFRDTGSCSYGDSCRYSHDDIGGKGTPSEGGTPAAAALDGATDNLALLVTVTGQAAVAAESRRTRHSQQD